MAFAISSEDDVHSALRELREAVERVDQEASTVQREGDVILERVRALAYIAQREGPWLEVFDTVVRPHYDLAMTWYFRALAQSSDPAESAAATTLKRGLVGLSAEFGHPDPLAE